MGEIKFIKKNDDDTVMLTITIPYEEYIQLGSHLKNAHIFSEDLNGDNILVLEKGRGYAAKYLPIPRRLRDEKINYKKAECKIIKIPSPDKLILISIIDRLNMG